MTPHAERRARLRDLVAAEVGHVPLLVTDIVNVRYLTGFSGSNAVLMLGVDPAEDVLGTDGRYKDQVRTQVPDLEPLIDRDTVTAVATAARRRDFAVEGSLSLEAWRSLGIDTAPVVAPRLVERLRAVKDAGELALLARACAITVEALTRLQAEMLPGVTEVALARRLEQLFGELGAEDRAFDSIVAAGPHSAIPHHEPGDRPLAVGDLLVVDAGARVDGYHADMTRTFVVGADPAPWQVEIHAAVAAAQAASAAAYRPGADCRAVDGIARGIITEAGYGDAFSHGLGHGVGLVIHEAPMIGPRATGTIGADMAITDEPGIYLPGRGGVRIEDTLVVTDHGPRALTEAPRDLVAVG